MTRTSRRREILIGAAVSCLAVAVLGTLAGATPGTPKATGATAPPAEITNQDDLSAYFTWLQAQPGLATSGYLAGIDDVDHRATQLMWKGKSPLQAAAIAEGRRRGITVTIAPRRHSTAELADAARAIRNSTGDPRWGDFEITSTSYLGADFDGLQIHGRYRDGTPKTPTPTNLTALAKAITGVDVRIVPGEKTMLW